jgi:predicted aconitase with swiveling domain
LIAAANRRRPVISISNDLFAGGSDPQEVAVMFDSKRDVDGRSVLGDVSVFHMSRLMHDIDPGDFA